MPQSTFSLTWDSHKNNICNGLSNLQQNEEFVDMTLAADGHYVKVHQMVIALASPYIKQLIISAACPHPVIFLNKISYTILTTMLEYIYTGEAHVSMEELPELVEAARELHIKGLEDMDLKESVRKYDKPMYSRGSEVEVEGSMGNMDEEVYFEVAASDRCSLSQKSTNYTLQDEGLTEDSSSIQAGTEDNEEGMVVEEEPTDEPKTDKQMHRLGGDGDVERKNEITGLPSEENVPTSIQYTVSNQGSLQMILNRYVYYLKHSNRNRSRQWRCVDYLNPRKCPALVVTKDDLVVQRISAHSHGFHDKRILKKVYANAVFTAIQEAEEKGAQVKSSQAKPKENTNTLENIRVIVEK